MARLLDLDRVSERPSPILSGARFSPPLFEALRSGEPVPVPYRGETLLAQPLLNKDTAFSREERAALGLLGLLPARVIGIDEQVALELEHVRRKSDELERYIGLAALQDRNETLFYRVLVENLEEFLPVVYTPTVGRACQAFSHILRRPRGIWITPDDIDRIPELLGNAGHEAVRLIVATDNERILGLGDQGAGGMGIPVGKLALYSAGAGIHPALTLPVSLDVGTDREELLADPLYIGYRKPRLRGEAYDEMVEAFVLGVLRVFPMAVLQWEDFKQHNAIRLLDRYRHRICSFNDDIQGTGSVVLAGILAGLRHMGAPLAGQRFVLLGAGAAGIGIARMLRESMRRIGLPADDIARSLVLLDSRGLLCDGRDAISSDKLEFALCGEAMAAYGLDPAEPHDLASVVAHVRPTVLVGTSGTARSFTEPAIREMARHTARPIILPLSNPTANTEASPEDVLAWTDGRALVATGSPFGAVASAGREHTVGQANNVFIFPGVGLGAIVCQAREVSDDFFLIAAECLAAHVTPERFATGALYPSVNDLRAVSRDIAVAIVRYASERGLGRAIRDDHVESLVDAAMWWPDYAPYEAI